MRVAVIGAGWFGCHIAMELAGMGADLSIFEAEHDIFLGASGCNQNRLHLGFHYPRSYRTREQSKDGFERFMASYPGLSSSVRENVYAIGERHSFLDFETYLQVMEASGLEFLLRDPKDFGLVRTTGGLSCGERLLDTKKARLFFRKELESQLRSGTRVYNLESFPTGVKVNGEPFDIVVNCTWCAFQPDRFPELYFEPCLMFLYKGEPDHPAITIMDGPFFSIFPYEDGLYTVTSVTHTPLGRFPTFEQARECLNGANSHSVDNLKSVIQCEVERHYPGFLDRFQYLDAIPAIKCKPPDATGSRVCIVDERDRVIQVVSGKIDSMFYAAQEVVTCIARYY